LEDREEEIRCIRERLGSGGVCEIGSGSGAHLLTLAQRAPHLPHFGFEIRYKRAVRTVEKAAELGLTNVFLLRTDARALSEIFPARSLHALYVNYPDPWEKRKRRKNRILAHPLLDTAHQVLKEGGFLSVKTDHEEYFCSFLECVAEHGVFHPAKLTFDLDTSPYRAESIETEFERLFRSQHLPLHFAELHRRGEA
jgi:tRNA (guanine-N7-)-methyltransferase